jgi:hypothetical protein
MGLRCWIITGEYKVINIEKNYEKRVTHFIAIDIWVIMTSRKVGVKKKAIHFGIPRERIFLKAI